MADNTWDFLGALPELQQQDMLRQQMAEALMRQQPPVPDGSVQSPSFNDALVPKADAYQQMPAGRPMNGPVQEQTQGRVYDPQFMQNGQLTARPDRSVPGVEMWIKPQPKAPMRGFR